MKIVVCVKVVPVSDSIITIIPDKNIIDPTNLKFDLNPYDEYANEAAVQLKEQFGGEVIAISIGPERDGLALKRVLALGADRLIHLISIDQPLADPQSVADILAGAINPISPDIIFCGKLAIDTGNGLVGPMLAKRLDLPFITAICEISVENNVVKVARETEKGREMSECPLPCLLTAEKGLNKPRYPSLKDILLSRKKETIFQNVSVPEKSSRLAKLSYPEPRPAGVVLGNDISVVPELLRRLREEARVL